METVSRSYHSATGSPTHLRQVQQHVAVLQLLLHGAGVAGWGGQAYQGGGGIIIIVSAVFSRKDMLYKMNRKRVNEDLQ